ncbi:serine hydrolase domain-containing protein [Amycolatopsis orientalis]|uniref:serine hydrolase domain-containing protein n=1 Tax=Amycolatopsis orientalis TaxID=31958 RepID=UPI001F20E611|nr:serine hydrolase domain-containing protein [Amycolatopsis orientalis]
MGTVASGWEGVRDAFESAQAQDEGAAQLAIYIDGQCVVDLCAGSDPIRGRPVDVDSLVVLMSVTKGLAALCTHLLAQRGLLDIEAPVAEYWPEFGVNGKAGIRVSDLLAHRAGLPGFEPERRFSELLDWDASVDALARMRPMWAPKTAYEYHTVTYGVLVGEVVRRVAGQSLGAFFASEVARPLGLDLWIGLPTSEEPRVLPTFRTIEYPTRAELVEQLAGFGLRESDAIVKSYVDRTMSLADMVPVLNSAAGRQAELPAVNAVGNARSLAKTYAAMIGSVDGVRLLTRESVDRLKSPQTDDLTLPVPLDRVPEPHPLRFGLGFELPRSAVPQFGPASFGHAGAGGRLAYADPDHGLAVGYTCTNMCWDGVVGPDARWVPWTDELHRVIGA